MAFGKTTKKKQNVAAKATGPEATLPVSGAKGRAKQPAKVAQLKESVQDSAPLQAARLVQSSNVVDSSIDLTTEQPEVTPARARAAAAGASIAEDTGASAGSYAVDSETTLVNGVSPVTTSRMQPSQEEISRRAYFYWAERGYQHGYAAEDWARAEAELTGDAGRS